MMHCDSIFSTFSVQLVGVKLTFTLFLSHLMLAFIFSRPQNNSESAQFPQQRRKKNPGDRILLWMSYLCNGEQTKPYLPRILAWFNTVISWRSYANSKLCQVKLKNLEYLSNYQWALQRFSVNLSTRERSWVVFIYLLAKVLSQYGLQWFLRLSRIFWCAKFRKTRLSVSLGLPQLTSWDSAPRWNLKLWYVIFL